MAGGVEETIGRRTLAGKGTTNPGYINRNCQINLGRTDPAWWGSDHGQYINVMHCPKCRTNYGANGTDIFQRSAPIARRVRPRLLVEGNESKRRPDLAPYRSNT